MITTKRTDVRNARGRSMLDSSIDARSADEHAWTFYERASGASAEVARSLLPNHGHRRGATCGADAINLACLAGHLGRFSNRAPRCLSAVVVAREGSVRQYSQLPRSRRRAVNQRSSRRPIVTAVLISA